VFINHHGQRKAKCVGDSKKAAEEVKRKLEAKLTLGDMRLLDAAHEAVSLGDYAEQWLAHYVAVACKPSSGHIMRGIVRNHLLPVLGAQELRSITRGQVKAFVAQKHQRYTPTYVRHLIRTLHTILAQAIDEELLNRNPAAKLGRVLPEQRRLPHRDINPFVNAELTHYLATMHTHYPQHYPYFLCLARTGMREGEALGLCWDDIQFGQGPEDPHRFLHIQRTYDPVHKTFNTPKNGRTRRVDMSQELRATLFELRNQRFDTAVLRGTTTIPSVVFCGHKGQPLSASGLYRVGGSA